MLLVLALLGVAYEHAEPDGPLFSAQADHLIQTSTSNKANAKTIYEPLLPPAPAFLPLPHLRQGQRSEPQGYPLHLPPPDLSWLCRRQVEAG